MKQRHIKQNIYGNWNGYIGSKKVIEFGTSRMDAQKWLVTGTIFPIFPDEWTEEDEKYLRSLA